ncbi:MAG: ATP synthase F1 subunit gamma [Malacoplasma sp.]
MPSINEIKKKIKIIESTKKITNAMKLVATSKMKKYKDYLFASHEFCGNFYDAFSFLGSNIDQLKNNCEKEITLWIVFTSSIGLCGSYNLNVIKSLQHKIGENDLIFLIGKKGYQILKTKLPNFNLYLNIDREEKNFTFLLFLELSHLILDDYKNGKFKYVKILYTNFVNSICFKNDVFSIIPIDDKISGRLTPPVDGSYFIAEPNKSELFNKLIYFYFAVAIYGSYIESKVSENATRRNSMDSATKNANDLVNSYKIKFNSVRQSKITQEINEIVSGSNVGENSE